MLEQRDEIIDLEVAELGTPRPIAAVNHFDFQMERIEMYIRLAPKVPLVEKLKPPRSIVNRWAWSPPLRRGDYPLGQVVQKVIPAILMGNTVVLKPSQHAPLTVYYLIDAFDRAGLPRGVLNLVTGRGGDVGDVLSAHPLVDMVSLRDPLPAVSRSARRLLTR